MGVRLGSLYTVNLSIVVTYGSETNNIKLTLIKIKHGIIKVIINGNVNNLVLIIVRPKEIVVSDKVEQNW